jgi:gluconate kinase
MNAEQLTGWTPARVFWQGAEPFVEWAMLGEIRLKEPFFEQTMGLAMHHPFNQLFRRRTQMSALAELEATSPGLPPRGFIFHMSRCGSTLISQMLAALSCNLVLSEAPPIDSVLHTQVKQPQVTDEERVKWLRGMVNALGQKRHEEERHLFIKFDSWHVLSLPLIERAFPGVPWIFLYREPLEVMASHLRSRGGQLLPGYLKPADVGLDAESMSRMSLDEYGARVLAKFCETALRCRQVGRGLLVNYSQLPDIFFDALLDHFGMSYAPEEIEHMRRATAFDAKRPGMQFKSDAAEKQSEVTAEARQLAERWMAPIYAELESARLP